jgi:hypothetical protein
MANPNPTEIRPAPELSRTVTGDRGSAIRTSEDGSIATDNYAYGDGFEHDGAAYPYTIKAANTPADTLQEIYLTNAGDIDMEITTALGDTFTIRLDGTIGTWSSYEIEEVAFRDPRGTAAPLYGGWAGEA